MQQLHQKMFSQIAGGTDNPEAACATARSACGSLTRDAERLMRKCGLTNRVAREVESIIEACEYMAAICPGIDHMKKTRNYIDNLFLHELFANHKK